MKRINIYIGFIFLIGIYWIEPFFPTQVYKKEFSLEEAERLATVTSLNTAIYDYSCNSVASVYYACKFLNKQGAYWSLRAFDFEVQKNHISRLAQFATSQKENHITSVRNLNRFFFISSCLLLGFNFLKPISQHFVYAGLAILVVSGLNLIKIREKDKEEMEGQEIIKYLDKIRSLQKPKRPKKNNN